MIVDASLVFVRGQDRQTCGIITTADLSLEFAALARPFFLLSPLVLPLSPVAMVMTSPQVVSDVRERYEGKVSLIASGMAGRPMVRTPALSLLTTSSLYAVGSAQYNRVRVPGDVVGAGNTGEIRYQRVGSTDSFGTVQFASDTTETLAAAARLAKQKAQTCQ